MSRGVNKVILVGHLGKDPEVRYTTSGAAVASVTLATSEQWKDKQSGQAQESTEWHNVVFYSRLAEIVGEYLKKGAQIYVEGSLRTRKWQDKEGKDRYTTEIIANEMQMLGGRGAGGSSPQSASSAPQSGLDMQGGQTGIERDRNQSGVPPRFDDFDDDIPFDICQRGSVA